MPKSKKSKNSCPRDEWVSDWVNEGQTGSQGRLAHNKKILQIYQTQQKIHNFVDLPNEIDKKQRRDICIIDIYT